MSTGRKVIAGLLMAIFLLVVMLAVSYAAVEFVLFDASAYQLAFDKSGMYEALTDYTVQFVFNQIATADDSGLVAQMTAGLGFEGQQQMARLILPEGYVRTQIDLLLVQLFAFLNFENEELTLFIDLREVRARFNSSNNQQIARLLILSWPTCSTNILGQLANLVLAPDLGNIPLCQPPAELQQPMIEWLASLIGVAAGSLPDQVDIAAGIDLAASQIDQLKSLFSFYRWGRLVFRLSPLISGALFVLLALTTIRPLQALLGWSSAALLQAALMGFLNAVLFWLVGRLLGAYLVQQAGEAAREISAALGQVIEVIASRMALWILAPSVVLMLVGLAAAGGAALAHSSARRLALKK